MITGHTITISRSDHPAFPDGPPASSAAHPRLSQGNLPYLRLHRLPVAVRAAVCLSPHHLDPRRVEEHAPSLAAIRRWPAAAHVGAGDLVSNVIQRDRTMTYRSITTRRSLSSPVHRAPPGRLCRPRSPSNTTPTIGIVRSSRPTASAAGRLRIWIIAGVVIVGVVAWLASRARSD